MLDGSGNEISADARVQEYGYTGRRYDAETGMWFFRARYFDSELGRFIGRDSKRAFPVKSMLRIQETIAEAKQKAVRRLILATLYEGEKAAGDALTNYHNVNDDNFSFAKASPLDGYSDGSSLYAGYFSPNYLDPYGQECSVYIGVRPIKVIGSGVPYWISPANHAFLIMPGWSAGYQNDSKVHIPELDPVAQQMYPAERKDDGKLPDGTKCCDATCEQIRECIKKEAKAGDPGEYNAITNSCGTWVENTLDKCCMVGDVPEHTYFNWF